MPSTSELTPEQQDALRQESSLHEITEQGGLEPLADDPFSASEAKAKKLSPEEVAEVTLAHNYRDARKLDFLINKGDLTTTEVSQASAEDLRTMVKRFEANHVLPLTGPRVEEKIEVKEAGHLAEDAIVRILNEAGLKVHAEHGSDYQDNLAKVDILLFIPTTAGDILVKVQNKSHAREEELGKIPANALLVELSNISLPASSGRRGSYRAEDVMQLASTGNRTDKRVFASRYLGLVLDALQRSPTNVYIQAKEALGLS